MTRAIKRRWVIPALHQCTRLLITTNFPLHRLLHFPKREVQLASKWRTLAMSFMKKFFLKNCKAIDSVGGEGGTWISFCWVCAAGLSEPLPHYGLFFGQLKTHLFHFLANVIFAIPNLVTFYLCIYLINPLNRS